MHSPVMTVSDTMSILEVAEKLLIEKPKMYPVVDADGLLVGCISRSQILAAIDNSSTPNTPKTA